MKTEIHLEVGRNGKIYSEDDKLQYTTEMISFTIRELLALVDIDLDAENPDAHNPYQDETKVPEEFKGLRPIYRLTGAKVVISLETSNYKFRKTKFDHTWRTRVYIYEEFSQPGWESWNCDYGWVLARVAREVMETKAIHQICSCLFADHILKSLSLK